MYLVVWLSGTLVEVQPTPPALSPEKQGARRESREMIALSSVSPTPKARIG